MSHQEVLDALNHKKVVNPKALETFHGSMAARNITMLLITKGKIQDRGGAQYKLMPNGEIRRADSGFMRLTKKQRMALRPEISTKFN